MVSTCLVDIINRKLVQYNANVSFAGSGLLTTDLTESSMSGAETHVVSATEDTNLTTPVKNVNEENGGNASDDHHLLEKGASHEVVDIISDSDEDTSDLILIDDDENGKTKNVSNGGTISETSIMSDEIEVVKETNSSDKDSCSICLSNFSNRSFLNDCFHAFCYYCILQWSEVSQTCPLCKKEFVTIIHDVTSITEYKVTNVKKDEPAHIPHNLRNVLRPTIRYRTTAISRPNPNNAPENVNARRKRKKRDGPRHDDDDIRIKEGRQRVYENNLFAKDHVDEGQQRLRKATPEFYTEFEGAKHRLFPWIRNDLEVLLYNDQQKVLEVLEMLWKLIDKHQITSDEFKEQVIPYLADKTNQFCHEMYMFAISPYNDWKTYLSKVQYDGKNGLSRWDSSPVRYIGDSIGSGEGDTISKSKWDVETPNRAESWSSSEIQFIGEKEMDVNITTNSSSSCESDLSSPKLLKITKTSSNDEPIDVDDMDDMDDDNNNNNNKESDDNTFPRTPVFIDLDDVPPTPTPPDSPVSRQNSPDSDRPVSPVRYNSPVNHIMQASPLKGMKLPDFPCSPIKNNSPVHSRSPSPLKGKGKEKKRKKSIAVPVMEEAPSPVRVLMDDSEPCSSKYLT